MFSSSSRLVSRAFVVAGRTATRPQQHQRLFLSTKDTGIVGQCQDKIQAALQADSVKVTGAFDDPNGSHIAIAVVSPLFTGKRAVQRQQMVYKAIWEELQGPVHAVDSMVCQTPDEATAAAE